MGNRQACGSRPPARDAAPVWDIAVPSRPGRMAGVCMAGFTNRAEDQVNLPMVPYPTVTLFIDLGDGVLIDDASGQQQRRSLAVGLAPSGVRGRGRPSASSRSASDSRLPPATAPSHPCPEPRDLDHPRALQPSLESEAYIRDRGGQPGRRRCTRRNSTAPATCGLRVAAAMRTDQLRRPAQPTRRSGAVTRTISRSHGQHDPQRC
jgi:hypothetical protein